MRQMTTADGYKYVFVCKERKQKKMPVHRAVLLSWVGPPDEGQECRHLNDCHDDNRFENLVWGTRGEKHRGQAKEWPYSIRRKDRWAQTHRSKHFRFWEKDDLHAVVAECVHYFNFIRPVRKLNGKPPVLFRTKLVA